MDTYYKVWKPEGGCVVKAWTEGVEVEASALEQVQNMAKMPFVKGVAVMPDVHWGMGATVGSVIAMQGAIIPAAVGVDLGCGVCALRTIAKEHHLGTDLLVTRKGAVRAREGDMGIIPGSMGTKSYIVRGRGNHHSFHSCSHGAGRRMSRTEAKRRFTLEDHAKATEGVDCRKDAGVLDETPGAYKDVDAVMAAQTDLVEVVATLKAVLCVKG